MLKCLLDLDREIDWLCKAVAGFSNGSLVDQRAGRYLSARPSNKCFSQTWLKLHINMWCAEIYHLNVEDTETCTRISTRRSHRVLGWDQPKVHTVPLSRGHPSRDHHCLNLFHNLIPESADFASLSSRLVQAVRKL